MAWVNLDKVLDDHEMSRYQFAKELGVPANDVYTYLKGSHDPKASTLVRWAAVLNCEVGDFFDESLEPPAEIQKRKNRIKSKIKKHHEKKHQAKSKRSGS